MYDANLGISISPELEESLRREAEQYVESVIGKALDLIPDPVKERIEQEYIEKRVAEIRTRIPPTIGPAALAIGGGILMFLLLGR